MDKEWLISKIEVEEAEAKYLISNERLGPKPVPFGFNNRGWKALLDIMQPDDELWEFCSPPKTWKALRGRSGIALVRKGEIIAGLVMMMN
jgi:hypothetical protein